MGKIVAYIAAFWGIKRTEKESETQKENGENHSFSVSQDIGSFKDSSCLEIQRGGEKVKTKEEKPNKQNLLVSVFGMMMNPAGTVKAAVEGTNWLFSIAISAVAFGLFFLQTGLDLYKTGQKGMDFVIMSGAMGLAYGAIVIPIISAMAWVILKMAKSDKDIKWTISSFCLSYSGALVYGIVGICFSFFMDWKTAVAFGVTGVLWAVGPMVATAREMTNRNNYASVFVATLYASLVLVSWSYFGRI